MYYYSKITKGFYTKEIHGDNIPKDVVEITAEYHQELMDAQSSGKQIVPDRNGKPVARDRVFTDAEKAESIRQQRDAKLRELDAIVSNPLRYAGFSERLKTLLAEYRQLLLDVPQQSTFPASVVWPEMPQV